MMHSNNVVVALRNANTHKPFREYDHDRFDSNSTARVVIPFDTEYELLVKVQDFERRHIVATIDGAEAIDLIIPPGESVIERFNDSIRKFKFVAASHAAVADPSSPDNGKLHVKFWKETPWTITTTPPLTWLPVGGGWGGGWGDSADLKHMYAQAHYVSNPLRGSVDVNASQHCLYACSMSLPTTPTEAKGATVEGSVSSQRYGNTTWRGDDSCSLLSFTFNLAGKTLEPQTGFCSECGSKLTQNAKFCHKCGKRV